MSQRGLSEILPSGERMSNTILMLYPLWGAHLVHGARERFAQIDGTEQHEEGHM